MLGFGYYGIPHVTFSWNNIAFSTAYQQTVLKSTATTDSPKIRVINMRAKLKLFVGVCDV